MPGAYAQALGAGGNATTLTAGTPLLGSSISVSIKDAPLGGLNLLLTSLPTFDGASPLLVSTSGSWIDLASVSVLSSFAAPDQTLGFAIPANPSFAGVSVNLQVWSIPPAGFPGTASDGVQLVLGN